MTRPHHHLTLPLLRSWRRSCMQFIIIENSHIILKPASKTNIEISIMDLEKTEKSNHKNDTIPCGILSSLKHELVIRNIKTLKVAFPTFFRISKTLDSSLKYNVGLASNKIVLLLFLC